MHAKEKFHSSGKFKNDIVTGCKDYGVTQWTLNVAIRYQPMTVFFTDIELLWSNELYKLHATEILERSRTCSLQQNCSAVNEYCVNGCCSNVDWAMTTEMMLLRTGQWITLFLVAAAPPCRPPGKLMDFFLRHLGSDASQQRVCDFLQSLTGTLCSNQQLSLLLLLQQAYKLNTDIFPVFSTRPPYISPPFILV